MIRIPDHYALLEVDPHAHIDVIRAAYRVLAQRYHPDRPTGSTERMTALNESWQVLRDEGTRASYDRERLGETDAVRVATPSPPPQEPRAEPAPEVPVDQGPLARRERAREPSSSILGFGRYAGWPVARVAMCDPAYLEWFIATPAGHSLAAEVHGFLAGRAHMEWQRVMS